MYKYKCSEQDTSQCCHCLLCAVIAAFIVFHVDMF